MFEAGNFKTDLLCLFALVSIVGISAQTATPAPALSTTSAAETTTPYNGSTTEPPNATLADTTVADLDLTTTNATVIAYTKNSTTATEPTVQPEPDVSTVGSISTTQIASTIPTTNSSHRTTTSDITETTTLADQSVALFQKYIVAVLIIVIFCFVLIAITLMVLLLNFSCGSRSSSSKYSRAPEPGETSDEASGSSPRLAMKESESPISEVQSSIMQPIPPPRLSPAYPQSPPLPPPPTAVRQEFPLVSFNAQYGGRTPEDNGVSDDEKLSVSEVARHSSEGVSPMNDESPVKPNSLSLTDNPLPATADC